MSALLGISFIVGVAIFIAVGIGALVIVNRVRKISENILGTSNVIKGMSDLKATTDAEMESRPKSVSAVTSLYLPKIKKDFPEFSYEEMKSRSQAVLLSYLKALDTEDASQLDDVTAEFRRTLENKLALTKGDKIYDHFRNPKIHQTEISNYSKQNGRCVITFQTSIQYNYYRIKDGNIIAGSQDRLTQSRYDIDCIYIQDRDKVEATFDEGLAFNCPNCGAPLKGLGAKTCSYCGSPVIEFNIKTWNFSDVRRTSST